MLISRVLSHDPSNTVVEAQIEASGQYLREQSADAVLALELAAQAVAAFVGLERKGGQGAARSGYIVGVPQMEFFGGDYYVGDRLRIAVALEFRDGPIGRFNFRIEDGTQLRAKGAVTVFEPSAEQSLEFGRNNEQEYRSE